jgi:metal-dependent amidase/aminoacylase/carboxypeptidase family protein
MNRKTIRAAAVAFTASAALVLGLAACENGTATKKDQASSSSPKQAASKAPSVSVVEEFKAYVAKNGTPQEQAAVKHVTKIQGGEDNNDILDTASIHTDFKGDLMDTDATGSATLLASSFAEFQKSRGNASKNGLVTVYNATGQILGNGKY